MLFERYFSIVEWLFFRLCVFVTVGLFILLMMHREELYYEVNFYALSIVLLGSFGWIGILACICSLVLGIAITPIVMLVVFIKKYF